LEKISFAISGMVRFHPNNQSSNGEKKVPICFEKIRENNA